MKHFFIMALLLGLCACSKPLPPEKQQYAGLWVAEWDNAGVSLWISADGRVEYERWKNNSSTSIDAPLKEFNGDNFIVGLGFITTEFEVSMPPHETEHGWRMTVDGVLLTRSD